MLLCWTGESSQRPPDYQSGTHLTDILDTNVLSIK